MHGRALPILVLVLSSAGMFWFARGLRLVDTVALLACGAVAGGALAALARARGKR